MRSGIFSGPSNIEVKFIVCIVGERDTKEVSQIIEDSLEYRDIIVAFGMATCEVGLPISKFKETFDQVRDAGFMTTSHFWDHECTSEIEIGLHSCKL